MWIDHKNHEISFAYKVKRETGDKYCVMGGRVYLY